MTDDLNRASSALTNALEQEVAAQFSGSLVTRQLQEQSKYGWLGSIPIARQLEDPNMVEASMIGSEWRARRKSMSVPKFAGGVSARFRRAFAVSSVTLADAGLVPALNTR